MGPKVQRKHWRSKGPPPTKMVVFRGDPRENTKGNQGAIKGTMHFLKKKDSNASAQKQRGAICTECGNGGTKGSGRGKEATAYRAPKYLACLWGLLLLGRFLPRDPAATARPGWGISGHPPVNRPFPGERNTISAVFDVPSAAPPCKIQRLKSPHTLRGPLAHQGSNRAVAGESPPGSPAGKGSIQI